MQRTILCRKDEDERSKAQRHPDLPSGHLEEAPVVLETIKEGKVRLHLDLSFAIVDRAKYL